MEITVISEEENPMLHRTDVRFRVSHAEATPDRLAVRDSLAARLNKDSDEVVIRKLDTKFGMRETVGEAKVYQGAEFAKDVEQEHMLVRNKIGAAGEVETEPTTEAAEAEEAAEEPEAGDADAEAEETEDEAEETDEAEEAVPEGDDEPEEEDAEASAEEAEESGEEEAEPPEAEEPADDADEIEDDVEETEE